MSRPGFTKAPCHGCGSTFGRPKDALCQYCRTSFDLAKRLEKDVGDNPDRVVLDAKERSYAMPTINMPGASRDAVRKAFHDLALLISQPTTEHAYLREAAGIDGGALWPFRRYESRSGDWKLSRTFDRRTAEALHAVYAAVQEGAEAARAEGHKAGTNLLMQLAAGEITSDSFNERAARME